MEPFKGFAIGNYATNGKLIGKGSFADVYLGHPVDSPTVLMREENNNKQTDDGFAFLIINHSTGKRGNQGYIKIEAH